MSNAGIGLPTRNVRNGPQGTKSFGFEPLRRDSGVNNERTNPSYIRRLIGHWRSLLPNSGKACAESITPEEDAALTKAALEDPGTVLITELSRRKPGRPVADITKTPGSIRLSPNVLDYFRSGGPGWQSRINDALREAAGLKKRA